MAFKGWPVEALEFYEGLEDDNSRAFWTGHKATYEAAVLEPTQALLDELAPTFGEGKMFRPNRDTRFSKDKSPYKTQMGVRVGPYGYVQISADGLGVGSGMFHLAADQLARFREAVDKERTGTQIEQLLAECADSVGAEPISHDVLKTAPRGYPKDHPRVGLLRMKGVAVYKQFPVAAWLGTAKAKDRVVSVLEAARPVNAWLEKHVGPSELPEG